jgi:hypothetical protein
MTEAAILPFFKDAAFDPGTTETMGRAFEQACTALQDSGQPDLVKEVIAKRIVQVAEPGERDPDKLCERALKALGIER